MPSHKLKLKRTPEEEAQHKRNKEKRREKKRKRREAEDYGGSSSSKRAHLESPNRGDHSTRTERKWASSDEDDSEYGPQPAPSGSGPNRESREEPNYQTLKAEIEERMFREKMFDAMGEDERLDEVEAHFNDYDHVPDRWKSAPSSSGKARLNFEGDEFLKLDPSALDEEEYVEWIRAGMYRYVFRCRTCRLLVSDWTQENARGRVCRTTAQESSQRGASG